MTLAVLLNLVPTPASLLPRARKGESIRTPAKAPRKRRTDGHRPPERPSAAPAYKAVTNGRPFTLPELSKLTGKEEQSLRVMMTRYVRKGVLLELDKVRGRFGKDIKVFQFVEGI